MTDQSIEQIAREIAERMAPGGEVWDSDIERITAGIKVGMEKAAGIADARAQKARDAISECENWSPAQAEHSRARDACLDISDAIRSAMP